MSGRLDLPTIIDAINHGEVHRVIRALRARDLNETVDAVLASREAMRKLIRVTEEAVGQQQRTHLEECLDGGFVKLAVQPIVDAQTTRPVAYEALLRSKHPVMDGPLPVLAAAERHDMLGDLSRAVIARAAEWLSRLDDNVKLFMNVHPNELADGDAFLERLAPLVPQSHRVVLEITERNRLGGITEWERVVESLTQAGFQLAVDDLGAGYSSLAVLAELQPAYVKVDMTPSATSTPTPARPRSTSSAASPTPPARPWWRRASRPRPRPTRSRSGATCCKATSSVDRPSRAPPTAQAAADPSASFLRPACPPPGRR